MKLMNLGCGSQIPAGHCKVDKFGNLDVQWDLETFRWPSPDNSVEETFLSHVLKHLGQEPNPFIAIMGELYRVSRDGATIQILVPHPRNDIFLIDPTHVWPIRPGGANTPLALYHDIDFELVSTRSKLDEPYRLLYRYKKIATQELQKLQRTLNNVVLKIEIVLRAKKPLA